MKATRFFQIALLILGLCCTIACNEDEVQDTDLILGRWDLREGLRNGSPTESLADLFFEFYEEGKMRTNITGSPVDCSYDIEGDQLEQRGGPMDINYTIQMLNDTMLSLTAKIHSYDFKLEMARTLQEE
jgi:hypothetical protein